MQTDSRTYRSLKNSGIALLFFVVQFLLGFWSRKIFLDCLGTEILGLNTAAANILQFLNLSEMGIGTAVGFSLYKPLRNRDYVAINEIVTMQGYLYRRIASFVVFGTLAVMCFFPLIFGKMQCPLWYAYASFTVLLFSSLLGYYVNYRQVVLVSAQMDYKIQLYVSSWQIVKTILQIAAVSRLSEPYVWWLVLEVVFAVITAFSLRMVTRQTFPTLRHSGHTYEELKAKYDSVLMKIKQLFIHKIGGFALQQSSPLIIYAYTSLSVVALYGNYAMIATGIMRLVNAVFNGFGAGIGNLVADDNPQREWQVFNEIYSIRFFISAVVTFSLITIGNKFISVWVGTEYVLPASTLALITLALFIHLNRATVNDFIHAHGLFEDTWSPLAATAIDIGSSIVLGYFYELNGILAGALLSLILIIDIWKPIILFRKGFGMRPLRYFKIYAKHLALGLVAAVMTWLVPVPRGDGQSWLQLSGFACAKISMYSVCLGALLLLFRTGLCRFADRFFKMIYISSQ